MQRAASVAWAFFVTPEEIQELREEIIEEALDTEAVTSMSDGTRSITKDADAAKKRLDLLDRLEVRTTPNSAMGLRFTQLVPPGGGG
jgi:hypothetical protein